MTSKKILGLDVSTRVVGYTVLDAKTGKHEYSSAIVLNSKASFVARGTQVHDVLEDLNIIKPTLAPFAKNSFAKVE